MRIASLLLCVITFLLALVGFGGAPGSLSSVAKMLFPIFLILFVGSLAAPKFRAHH